eukprot:6665136-Pyramimonas_sp.AAC.1
MDVCSFRGGAAAVETSMASIVDMNRQLRLEATCLRMEEKMIDDAIVKWHDTEGQELIRSIFGQMDVSAHRGGELIPSTLSAASLTSFVWESLDISERVKRALSCGDQVTRNQLTQVLANIWSGFHETIDHVPHPEWDDDYPTPKPCTKVGFCVCTGAGRDVKKFIDNVDVAVKRACPVGI